jgi:acyl-CoA thioesterase
MPPSVTDGAGVLAGRLELRLARGRRRPEGDGRAGDGRVCMWARVTGALEPSAAWLAVIGDLVPSGVANARGVVGGGNSLDNTLRVLRLVASDWILCDIGIDGMARGFAHGWAHLWAEDGTLMGTASQSVIVRSRS